MFLNICYRRESVEHVCIACALLQVLGLLWGLIDEKDLVPSPRDSRKT